MNHLTRAKSVFEMEIEELRGVLSRLDDNFNQAVELMSQALDRGNKIVIVGVGKSGNIGAKNRRHPELHRNAHRPAGFPERPARGPGHRPGRRRLHRDVLLRGNLGTAGPAPFHQTL